MNTARTPVTVALTRSPAVRAAVLASAVVFAVLGILAGTRLVRAATPAQLKRAFAIFLLVVGAFVFYQNRAVFHRAEPAGGVMRTH